MTHGLGTGLELAGMLKFLKERPSFPCIYSPIIRDEREISEFGIKYSIV